MKTPDMKKVLAAVERLKAPAPVVRPKASPVDPVDPVAPVARDAAIRKPLKSHGNPCSGFFHPNFLHND